MHIEFAIFYKYLNYQDFEMNIAKANVIQYEVFCKTYNEGECPSDKLVIGSINDKPVCCGILPHLFLAQLLIQEIMIIKLY